MVFLTIFDQFLLDDRICESKILRQKFEKESKEPLRLSKLSIFPLQWCHRGECVGMAPEQLAKQDGNWGYWKEWGQCSRSCGGGIQKALRDCDSPRWKFLKRLSLLIEQ